MARVKTTQIPEDAEDHNGCGEGDEGHTVADGVANLNLQKELSLQKTKQQHRKNNVNS